MTGTAASLFTLLNTRHIAYCHWKSNCSLEEALRGIGDLDLFVPEHAAAQFKSVLSELKYREAESFGWDQNAFVHHYFGLDYETGQIIHLHVYYRLVTGGSQVKAYRLPLEEAMIRNSHLSGNVRIPTKGLELLLFVLRKSVEHASPAECYLLRRERQGIAKELEWLRDSKAEAEALAILERDLPAISKELFLTSMNALHQWSSTWQRIVLGFRCRSQLKQYAVVGPMRASLLALYRLIRRAFHKIVLRRGPSLRFRRGVMIAFVGPDSSGKSTLLRNTKDWLKSYFDVRYEHLGKPHSSWLTLVPNLLLPLSRWLFPKDRLNRAMGTMTFQDGHARVTSPPSLLTTLRSMFVAFDQQRSIKRAARHAQHGSLALCDRYPSATLGGTDGPRIDPDLFTSKFSLRRFLAKTEQRIYRNTPTPGLVVFLSVPVEVAVQRNASRATNEDETYIRQRHALMEQWQLPGAPITRISNEGHLEASMLAVKSAIWNASW